MSDITITIDPPNTNSITVNQGLAAHNTTHAPGGSDSLTTWYALAADLTGISGQISFPNNVVFTTGDQNISGEKNFYSRPTINGTGVLLSGEASAPNTGYLTGYVSKTETGGFVSSSQTGSFLTSGQTGALTGSFYPLNSNPSGYVVGAVVRPSNTGEFIDKGSSQTISGQKTFTARLLAPMANIGTGNFIGGGNNQTIIGDYNGVTGSFNYIFGGSGNSISNRSLSQSTCKDNKIIGSDNSINGDSVYNSVIIGKTSSLRDSSISSITSPTYNSNILIGDSNNIYFFDDELETNVNGNLLIGNDNQLLNGGVGNVLIGNTNTSTSRTAYSIVLGNTNEIVSNQSITIGFYAVSSGENTVLIKGPSGVLIDGPLFFNSRPTYNGTGFLLSGEASSVSTTGISISGDSTKTIFLYQSDGSTLSGSFTDQQGTGSGGDNFYIYSGSFNTSDGNLTLNRTGDAGTVVVSLEGRYVTGSVVRPSETGVFYPTSNPSGYITTADLSPYSTIVSTTGISGYLQAQITTNNQTGAFLTTGAADSRYALQSATGAYTGEFYPLSSNPSNYLVAADLSSYATQAYVTGTSGYLQGQITPLQSATGNLNTRLVAVEGVTGSFVTGLVVRPSETGSFLVAADLSPYATTIFTTGISGHLQTQVNSINSTSGAFLTTGAGDTRYIVQPNSGLFVPYNGATGNVNLGANNLSVHLVKADLSDGLILASSNGTTGIVVGAGGGANATIYGDLKLDYITANVVPIIDAAKNVIASSVTTGELNYLTGVTSPIQNQITAINNGTGSFVTSSQTGAFYPITNPSGYVTGVDLSTYATTTFVTGISGYQGGLISSLQSATGTLNTRVTAIEGVTGSFALSSNTGAFLTTGAGDGRYALQSNTGSFVTTSQTGAFASNDYVNQYVEYLYVDAGAMLTGVSGATAGTTTIGVSGLAYDSFDFDSTAVEYTNFKVALPSWNLSPIKAKFQWSSTVAGTATWSIRAQAINNGDSLNNTWGTVQQVSGTLSPASGLNITAATPSITVGGTPSSGALVVFHVYRDPNHGSDTLAADAQLLGVALQYTGVRTSAW